MSHPDRYSRLQITLHWTIAVLIVVQLTVNGDMQQAFAQRVSSGEIPANSGAIFHMMVGVSVLILALLRLVVRLIRGTPAPPPGNSALVNLLSHATHLLLYGFLLFMPLTGALAWFFGIELAAVLHELGRLVLIPAILLHIAGVVVEELVLDNRIFRRMVRSERPYDGTASLHQPFLRHSQNKRRILMDWNRVEGNWKQMSGKIKEQWGKLTDDDITEINGKRDQLEGKIQERYGHAKDDVRKDVDTWYDRQTW